MDSKDKLVTLEDLKAVHDEVARYTTCSTAASTAAKTAALTNFVLTTGSCVRVKFTNSNTAANPTLNINSTGAKPIMLYGITAVGITPSESWNDGAVVEFVYDGTNWIISDAVSKNAIEIPVNADLNDYVTIGEYFCASSANVQTLSNCPVTASFNMIVGKRSSNYIVQQIETGASLWTRTSSSSGWNVWHPFARADGDTFSGDVTIDRQDGTASTEGWSGITVGNNIAKGTANNSTGYVRIFGKTGYRTDLNHQSDGQPTANRALYLPDVTGTIMTNQGGTFSGRVYIDQHNGTASTMGASEIDLGNNIAEGTTGNSRGIVILYSPQTYWTAFYSADTQTANRHIKLPDASGTIALVENGSNSNGNYTKFSDGTLMQWGFKSGIMATASNTVSATINFPVAFTSASTASITAIPETTLAQHFRLSVSSIATSSFAIYVYSSYSTTASLTVRWTAIGRWK